MFAPLLMLGSVRATNHSSVHTGAGFKRTSKKSAHFTTYDCCIQYAHHTSLYLYLCSNHPMIPLQ